MYAAAGGASLASRKARQNKQKKFQAQQARIRATNEVPPPHVQKSRQFHQLPANYLRTPCSGSQSDRKLSGASFAAQSKLLLPIHEGHLPPHLHHHRHPISGSYGYSNQTIINQQSQYHSHLPHGTVLHHSRQNLHHGRPSAPRLSQTDDGLLIAKPHLTRSATASFPLVSQIEATPPATPLISIDKNKLLPPGKSNFIIGDDADLVNVDEPTATTALIPAVISITEDDQKDKTDITTAAACATTTLTTTSTLETVGHLHVLPIPQDSIIVTPATPLPSPGHSIKAPSTSSQAAEEKDFFGPGPFRLERKCSFNRVRPRRSTAFETYEECQSFLDPTGHGLTQAQLHHYRDYTDDSVLLHPPIGNGTKDSHKYSQCAYCEDGICLCEHIECAQGRAAWLERERIRRCSVQDKENNTPASCHRKWVKRNRIQDSSLGGSSDDEDLLGVLRGPSNFANAFLYVGLGTVAIGLVIAFVGTGEKGFKTVELRLIGPSLIGIGLICCILRICFCICPSSCISSSRRARKKNSNKVDADHTTSLLRGENKRVSIEKGPHRFPLGRKKSNNKMMNEGMEALRQIATTSLFLQNEQKPASSNRVVPIIKEPETIHDSPLEMKKIDTTLNISDITDDEDEDDESRAIIPSHYNNNINTHNKTSSKLATATAILQSNNIDAHDNIDEESSSTPLVRTESKLARKRLSTHQQKQPFVGQQNISSPPSESPGAATPSLSVPLTATVIQTGSHHLTNQTKKQIDAESLLMETSLMVINPTTESNNRPPLTLDTLSITTTAATTTTKALTPTIIDAKSKLILNENNTKTILPSSSIINKLPPPPPSSSTSIGKISSPPPSASSLRNNFDLPKSSGSLSIGKHKTEAQNYDRKQKQLQLFELQREQQNTPGQIFDFAPTSSSSSSSSSLFLTSSTAITSSVATAFKAEEGAIGGSTNLLLPRQQSTLLSKKSIMPIIPPPPPPSHPTLSSTSLTSNIGSQLILTPSLLPGSVPSSAHFNSNNNNNANNKNSFKNMISSKPSTSSITSTTNLLSQLTPPPLQTGLQTEPELVLSPAKLGQ